MAVPADPFAAFLSLRPAPHEAVAPHDEHLRLVVLRAKRQLLEVAMQEELQTLDPQCPDLTADRMQKITRAQQFLETRSAPGEEAASTTPLPAVFDSRSGFRFVNASGQFSPARSSPRGGIPPPPAELSPRSVTPPSPPKSPLRASASAPNLKAPTESLEKRRPQELDDDLLQAQRKPVKLPDIREVKQKEPASPLLSSWWTKTRCWNIIIAKRDLTARRRELHMPGGGVVLGNGHVPLFAGAHLLTTGYFFSFQVEAVDDENFPLQGMKDMSFGLGVSQFPAGDSKCDRPTYAYTIPGCVLVGYGARLIDQGLWRNVAWDPKDLKVNDVVGVLVSQEADLVIYVNGEQVLRVPTSLGKRDGEEKRRQYLYPLVDLHGRVSAVTLLPQAGPPNIPLQYRNRFR